MAASTHHHDPQRRHPLATARFVVGGLLLLALMVFVLQNLEKVEIDFLWLEIETNLLVAMLLCALAGAAATLLLTRRLPG
jgi:uncharacterized integral membrane protein